MRSPTAPSLTFVLSRKHHTVPSFFAFASVSAVSSPIPQHVGARYDGITDSDAAPRQFVLADFFCLLIFLLSRARTSAYQGGMPIKCGAL